MKFGLIGTASSLKKGSSSAAGAAGKGRPIGSKPAPRRRPPGSTSVFDANSDDEEEESKGDLSGVTAVNKRLAAISAKQEKQAKKEYEDALQADPSVFDYDRVYDGMKERCEQISSPATLFSTSSLLLATFPIILCSCPCIYSLGYDFTTYVGVLWC